MKNKRMFKITDENGKTVITDKLTRFAKDVGVYYGQFYNALKGDGYTKKGGFKIEIVDGNMSQNKETTPTNNSPNSIQILDMIKEGNTHKVKFTTPKGETRTRKLNIKRADNMYGIKCDYSGVNIPMGQLYATCNNGNESYIFSVDQIKSLGYEFNIDFDFNTKVIEKRVEVFTPERLEEVWLEKMDKVTKEIAAVQKKLTQLKEAKEYIGQSLSQTKAMNERLSVADNYLKKLL